MLSDRDSHGSSMALIVSPEALKGLDDEAAFVAFCARHPEWRLERDPAGALVVMPPVGGLGGHRAMRPLAALARWNDAAGQPGLVFSSQTMFRLPGGDGARPMPPGWPGSGGAPHQTPADRVPPDRPGLRDRDPVPERSPIRPAREDGRVHAKRRAARLASRSGRDPHREDLSADRPKTHP
jgi:hypothetical protein